jgi:hypothetical protein
VKDVRGDRIITRAGENRAGGGGDLRKRAGRGSNEETNTQGSQGKKAVEFYAALVLALALAAVAGVLYFYVMFLEGRSRQQRRHIADLERSNGELRRELEQTRALLDRELEHSRTLWPELLDETGDLSRN